MLQTSAVQFAIAVLPHVRSAVALHAAVSYVPVGHASVEQATHALPLRNVPGVHARHLASVAVVQTSSAQPAIAVHPPHVRSAVAVLAAVSKVPVGHASVEHATHAMPLRSVSGVLVLLVFF